VNHKKSEDETMKVRILLPVLFAGLAVANLAQAAKMETFTGEISDTMCGTKHMMASRAECTRACVQKGSSYALVAGDKIYTLKTDDKATLDQLSSLAGEKAKVTGTAHADTIEVKKISTAQ
jgi:hypothetical protein